LDEPFVDSMEAEVDLEVYGVAPLFSILGGWYDPMQGHSTNQYVRLVVMPPS